MSKVGSESRPDAFGELDFHVPGALWNAYFAPGKTAISALALPTPARVRVGKGVQYRYLDVPRGVAFELGEILDETARKALAPGNLSPDARLSHYAARRMAGTLRTALASRLRSTNIY